MFKQKSTKMKVIMFLLMVLLCVSGAWTTFIQTSVTANGKDIVKLDTTVMGWSTTQASVERAVIRMDASADLIMMSNDRLMQHMIDCSLRLIDHENMCDDWRDRHDDEHKDQGE